MKKNKMTRANKKNVERMRNYVLSSLNSSGYGIEKELSEDSIRIVNPYGIPEMQFYDLFLNYDTGNVSDWSHRFHQAIHEGRNVANIFYKETRDEQKPIFFIQPGDNQLFQKRDKSLKNYSWNDLKHLVHLREKEKEVLRMQTSKYSGGLPRLVYFEPSNLSFGGRIPEGFASFDFTRSRRDYSHIEDERKDFVAGHDGTNLVDYMFSGNKKKFDCDLDFVPVRKGSKVHVLTGKLDKGLTEQEFRKQQIDYFLHQTGTKQEDWSVEELEKKVFGD